MLDQINELRNLIKSFQIENENSLEEFRIKFLSKKGHINDLFEQFKLISGEEKREVGKQLNILRQETEAILESAKEKYEKKSNTQTQAFDNSLPVNAFKIGSLHPINLVKKEIIDIFNKIGFSVAYGPEIEDEWHNFSSLNFAENHPARDMQDTFFVNQDPQGNFALRTHTSSVQIRLMENERPPIRSLMPGRVYRNEAVSARSNCFFHQIEGLYIDENVSFADLKQTLYYFVSQFFGEREIRFRPSYFPFTEPSAEMDIFLGTATEQDYRLTKGTGWLEILGCGMVDPNVLINCKIDPEKYSGFAFGMGIDRITMLKYGIKDIRQMFENDLRFLQQF
ncbi:MAG: phenylalanine--tRNA ligase subunit alpha [Bacteroidota bacterium]|nr:phenylalanine--tRNA ligase subunit alpha [Bacteroidota bacterium]